MHELTPGETNSPRHSIRHSSPEGRPRRRSDPDDPGEVTRPRRPPFSSAALSEEALGETSIDRLLHVEAHCIFPDESFPDLFTTKGRRSSRRASSAS